MSGSFKRATLYFFLTFMIFASSALSVPRGESPYIYGIHDWTSDAVDFFVTASSGSDCVRGWILHAEAIGDSGSHGGGDFSSLTSAGFGVIVRLDYSWGAGTLPDPDRFDEFAATFADYVRNTRGDVHVWIVANEPNLMWGGRNFSPQEYARAYTMVRNAVHAVPGHENDQVLVTAMGIWADHPDLYGDWLYDYFTEILDVIGGDYDGFAIHAYTREFSVGAIQSDQMWPDGTHQWHLHFRVYRDVCHLLRSRCILNVPLYITEAGNVCDPPCDPYPDADIGYFVAMYNEVDAWNQAHPDQIIRAVIPYRWTRNDDGTGRDFCSGPLKSDLQRAIAGGQIWTDTGCPGSVPSDPSEPTTEIPAEVSEETKDGTESAETEETMGRGDANETTDATETPPSPDATGPDSGYENPSDDIEIPPRTVFISGGCCCATVR